jgi:CheY-like chemotaxis protein
LGIQGFLVKPIDPHEMLAMLNTLICRTANVEARAAPTHQPNAHLHSSPQRVLLVEDAPINQTLATILLSRMGYDISIANNGVEAVEAFSSGPFDLILMDIQMPAMSGIEATEIIRAMEQASLKPRTPIIAVTANALKGDRERYMEAGMDGYVSKPIAVESLRSEIRRVSPKLQPPNSPPDGQT